MKTAVGKAPQKLGSRGRTVEGVCSHSWSSKYEPAGSGELNSHSSNGSSSGSGLIGLRDMFSLDAVGRGRLLTCSLLSESKGMVSDLFILLRTLWYLEAAAGMLPITCLRVEAGGVGSRVGGGTIEESRVCEKDGMRDSCFL